MQEAALIEIRSSGPGGYAGSDGPSRTPGIAIDELAGTVQVCDPRLFRAAERAFCRRLLETATRRPAVRQVEVDLESATCRIEFGPGSLPTADMANTFAAAVREATKASPNAERAPIWQLPPDWCALTAYRRSGSGESSLWETLERTPGRIRVRNRGRAGDHGRLARLADVLPGIEGIEGCHLAQWSGLLTVDFRPESPIAQRILDEVERVLEDIRGSEQLHPKRTPSALRDDAPEVATGLLFLRNLALAAGSFVLTLVGLFVPGIPTVPFMLATSYYLARSSPWLDEKFRGMAFFGPILTEWEQYGGLSQRSKEKLIGLSGVILLVTVALAPLSPLTVVAIVLLWCLSIYWVTRLPALVVT